MLTVEQRHPMQQRCQTRASSLPEAGTVWPNRNPFFFEKENRPRRTSSNSTGPTGVTLATNTKKQSVQQQVVKFQRAAVT